MEHEIDLGDVVVDRDVDDKNEAVVVNTPEEVAEDWYVPGRGQLDEDNPDYPSTDPVVVVVFRETLDEERPYYGGHRALILSDLNEDEIPIYAFPESRLRVVGAVGLPEISLEKIDPSPYHARTFNHAENDRYIEAIRERGRPKSPPLLRPVGERFEIVNGHKRIWASHVAGLDAVPCQVRRLGDQEAAEIWAQKHLGGYTPEQATAAVDRLHAQLGPAADAVGYEVYLPDDVSAGDCDA